MTRALGRESKQHGLPLQARFAHSTDGRISLVAFRPELEAHPGRRSLCRVARATIGHRPPQNGMLWIEGETGYPPIDVQYANNGNDLRRIVAPAPTYSMQICAVGTRLASYQNEPSGAAEHHQNNRDHQPAERRRRVVEHRALRSVVLVHRRVPALCIGGVSCCSEYRRRRWCHPPIRRNDRAIGVCLERLFSRSGRLTRLRTSPSGRAAPREPQISTSTGSASRQLGR